MDMNRLKALLKGSQVGATMGGSDELAGATQKLMGIIDPSQLEANKKLKDQGFTGDIGPTNPEEMYTQSRNEERADIANAKTKDPVAFLTGQAIGGTLGATAPGPSVLNAKSLLGTVASGAGMGALGGALSSDKEGMDRTGDAALGAGMGAAGGAAFQKLKGKLNLDDFQRMVGNEIGAVGKIRYDIPAQDILDALETPEVKEYLQVAKLSYGLGSNQYQMIKENVINAIKNKLGQKIDASKLVTKK